MSKPESAPTKEVDYKTKSSNIQMWKTFTSAPAQHSSEPYAIHAVQMHGAQVHSA